MEDIKERWFYDTLPPYEDYFERIEKALGFKLVIWQKTFIVNGTFRHFGRTTAWSIKRLSPDNPPIDLTERPSSKREEIERHNLVKIYEKLKNEEIETCPVFFTRRDKERYERGDYKADTSRCGDSSTRHPV